VRWLALAAGVAVLGVLVWSLVPDGGSGTGNDSAADPEQGQYSAPAPTLSAGDCINAAYDGSTWRPKSEPPEPLTCGSDPHTNYVVEKVGLAGQELDCHGPTRIKWQPPGSSEPLCLSRYLDNSPCLPVHETSSGRIDKALITVVAPCGSRPKIHGTTWHTRKVAYERTYPGVPESDCGHETPLVVVPEESVLCMSK
jgi:hypothetical protein